jgi:hypothetical protein
MFVMVFSKVGRGKKTFKGSIVINGSDEDVAALRATGVFDASWYSNEYPDVAITGIDPERHYLWIGRRLGRLPCGSGTTAVMATGVVVEPEAVLDRVAPPPFADDPRSPARRLIEKPRSRIERRGEDIDANVFDVIEKDFDIDFYLTTYLDIGEAGVDPIEHYMREGWREGRDPSFIFSTRFYLENNPDVVAAGVNPFYHFLLAGKVEGRIGRHELGFRWNILSRLKPVADQIAEYKSHRIAVLNDPHSVLQAELAQALAKYPTKLLVSFSHDNYTRHVGGIQLLVRREVELLRADGYLQMHFYPVHPLPFLDTSGEPVQLGVLLDGKLVGVFHPRDIVACLTHADTVGYDRRFVIHNLLGHNMDQTIAIITASGARQGNFWIHDFAALYNNYKLLRNDVEYTGVPRRGTLGWELCEFARADFSHPDEFAKLFGMFDIDLLSPSPSSLAIWEEAGIHKTRSSRVIPHVTLLHSGLSRPDQGNDGRPLRIGFIGYPADHKGWSVFENLVFKMGGDPRYEFHHLGKGRRGGLPVAYREVVACESEPDLMRKSTAATRLDVAIIWSIWPETFCLTAYEALAGGAAIVTNKCAGNVVDLVENIGPGEVFDSEEDLHAAFETGDILQFARTRRAVQHYQLEYSAMTLDIMENDG